MITFRTDETNFAQGLRSSVRLVPGAGARVDFAEADPDPSTLGLWHLHNAGCTGEGDGLADASGHGCTFVNHGAAVEEDGRAFVAAESDFMDVPLGSRPACSQATLECWGRRWQTPVGVAGILAVYYEGYGRSFDLVAMRSAVPANSYIATRCIYGGGSTVTAAQWIGTEVDALLASGDPFHLAAVLNAPAGLALYVNGVRRALTTAGVGSLPAAAYTLYLGRYGSGAASASAVLDEVRLSGAVLYTSDFPAPRLHAAGTLTGPALDAARTGAAWSGLVAQGEFPAGTSLAWDVRAADLLDAAGDPAADWQPWSGDPAALPRGRYFQWRAGLSSAADRLTTPTLAAVEAVASEAGCNLYRAAGDGPEAIDFAAPPWARVGPGITQVQTEPLAPAAVHWFAIRPTDADGRETPVAQDEPRLELDAAGARVPDRPAPVLALDARPLAGGTARLAWLYRAAPGGPPAATFRVFGDGGTGTIDYASPLAAVAGVGGQRTYTWTSDVLSPAGVMHQLAVQAVAADGTDDGCPAIAAVTPDAVPPAPVDALEAEVLS